MQAQQRPRFRQDLVAELVEEQGARFIDVADPDSGNIFRFYEVEYSLACAMDGERDVAGIVKWAQEELGLTPSASEVQTVIATLADLRFIDVGDHTAADARDSKGASKAAAEGADQELARGVVVGKGAHAEAAADVELGRSGSTAKPVKEDVPAAAELALGAPGAAPAAKAAKAPVDDIALGAPGARAAEPAKPAKAPQSEVSIDLAAHVDVRPDDVKEAVRASKVMAAVDVPKELIEAEKPAASSEVVAKAASAKAAASEKVAAKATAQAAASEKAAATDKAASKAADKAAASDKAAAKAADKAAAKPAVELPAKPAADKKPVEAPPAPSGGVSPALIVLLILAVVGAGAFFVWKYVIDKPEEAPAPTAQTTPPPTPPVPAPPPVVTSKIAIETPPAQDVKAPAGTIDTLEAADKDVKAGDVIGMLVGHKPLETEIAAIQKDIDKRVQVELDAATKERDAAQAAGNKAAVTTADAKIADRKKSLDAKTATMTAKKGELDKLTLKAPTDGKLTLVAKPGQKVAADEVVATIVKPTVPVAIFKVPAGTKVAADGNLSLTVGKGDQVVVCTVSDAQAETIKVACPADANLADGTDVAFKLPQ